MFSPRQVEESGFEDAVRENLGSPVPLVRTRGLQQLKSHLDQHPQHAPALWDTVLALCAADSWQARHGGFSGAHILLSAGAPCAAVTQAISSLAFSSLQDSEPRVAMAAAECLRAGAAGPFTPEITLQLWKDLVSTASLSVHDADPSRLDAVATSWCSILSIFLSGCTELEFFPSVLIVLLCSAFSARNRGGKQAIITLIAAICHKFQVQLAQDHESLKYTLECLRFGLQDDSPPVRMAAVKCVIQVLGAPSSSFSSDEIAILVPGICLNRYSIAEGLRLVSLEAWKLLTEKLECDGKTLVSRFIFEIATLYYSQCKSENREIRESTCHCISELCQKIPSFSVLPFVPQLFSGIKELLGDKHWQVRDAAACAIADIFQVFGMHDSFDFISSLSSLQLLIGDKAKTVRENSAIAIGKLCAHNDSSVVSEVFKFLEHGLDISKSSPDDCKHSVCSKCSHSTRVRWELPDGCMYLLREMSCLHPEECSRFIPTVLALARACDFEEHQILKDTVFVQILGLKRNLGSEFEQFIPELTEILTYWCDRPDAFCHRSALTLKCSIHLAK